ncbi:DUF3885 domain-containing protein [Eleftheria terrae]|uniref:DUF3885 domain-containing protein n=1 Tax=Eleftheria terrae TaxID=1597781 RepID=UPI00263BE663|nr:hypothetical protein [Eleftheria terrae]WKB56073.1 hypothetical protein N7L95_28860 [Eleftheria terrae]
MRIRDEIENVFNGKTFLRPLFYRYPGGLRFELSEGGSAIDQFLTALRKGQQICESVFEGQQVLTVCLRVRGPSQPFAYRHLLRELAGC